METYPLDTYFENHPTVFATILFVSLALINVLFVAALIHALNGTKYKFVVIMAVATIVNVICYAVYAWLRIYAYSNEEFQGLCSFFYFLALAIFQEQHWILAFTYYTCANELPYVFRQEAIPDNSKLAKRFILWSVIAVSALSSLWPFFQNEN